MPFKAICLIFFSLIFARSTWALEVCGDLKQGELLLIKDVNAKQLVVYEKDIETTYLPDEDGNFLVALERNTPEKITVAAYPFTDAGTFYDLKIAPAQWDIQKINGVEQHKVTPDKRHEKEIARELNDVRRVLAQTESNCFWQNGFMLPLDGRISGNFGNQRIFNGVAKNPHSGTDIAAKEGTPVVAAGNGKVVLNGKDYFYTGNMVIISHGSGLYTIYAHLQKSNVTVGDVVNKGDVIGYVGKTGRATGAHLHWGAVASGIRFRPHSLLDLENKKCQKIQGKYMGE